MHPYRWDTGLEPRLQRIAERMGRLRQARMNPLAVQNLRHWFRIHHTYHSNAIEGNRLTLPETRAVLEDGITISGKSLKDHLEAVNLAQALDFIQELAQAKEPLAEREVRDIHAIVLRAIEGGHAGQYRRINVRIGGSDYVPPEALVVPERMREFAQWLSGDKAEHPLVVSAIAHAWFETIHPFIDGNGRTGRLLANLLLMRQGYPVTVLRVEERARYYTALDQSHTGDLSLMVELTLETVERSLAEYERVIQEVEVREPEIEYLVERLSKVHEAGSPEYLTWKYGVEALQRNLVETAERISTRLDGQTTDIKLSFDPSPVTEKLWRGARTSRERVGRFHAVSPLADFFADLLAQPPGVTRHWLDTDTPVMTMDFEESADDPEHMVLAVPDKHLFTTLSARGTAIDALGLGTYSETNKALREFSRLSQPFFGAHKSVLEQNTPLEQVPEVRMTKQVSAMKVATDVWTYIIKHRLT